MRSVTLANRLDELDRLFDFLSGLAREGVVPDSEVGPLNLVLEELVTNVIRHGLDDDEHMIRIGIECNEDRIEIEVQDDGLPFDPHDAPAPDLESPLGDRPVGGLGLHLVRSLTEGLEYERVDTSNVIRLVRRIA